jgi:hypothetical protein
MRDRKRGAHGMLIGARGQVILTKTIPVNAQDFVRRCSHDCRVSRYAKDGDYLEFLIAETRKSHQKLLEFLRVVEQKVGNAERDEALVFPGDLVNLSSLDKLPARGAGTNWMGGS